MCSCATQSFSIHIFSYGSFYQVGAGEVNGACAFYHNGFITHDGKVSATSHTGTGNHGYLCNSHGTHACIVSKDAAKVFFVRKNFILHRKVYTCAIYNINDRQKILHGNFLHAQIFFTSDGKPCPCFYGLIISHNNALSSAYISNATYCSARRAAALLFIHFITRKCTNLYKWSTFIAQVSDTLPGYQFISFLLF